MNPASTPSRAGNLLIPLLNTFIIVTILFTLDEGYYDFRWMFSAGNWFVFAVYVLLVSPLPFAVHFLLFRKKTGWKKAVLEASVSIPAALALSIILFMD